MMSLYVTVKPFSLIYKNDALVTTNIIFIETYIREITRIYTNNQ